jgi:multicomponent Na+:H+ antiporter subunit E
MGELIAILAVTLLWGFLNGGMSLVNTIVGALLGMLLLSVVRRGKGDGFPRRLWGVIRFVLVFFLEVIKAGILVSRLAISPRPRFHPHVIAVPLRVESDAAISLLSLATALIPGTLPMGISADHAFMYAHTINERDPELHREGIIRIESLILEFMK